MAGVLIELLLAPFAFELFVKLLDELLKLELKLLFVDNQFNTQRIIVLTLVSITRLII